MEVRLYAVAAELSRQNGQIFQRFHGSYLLQLSLDGRPALAVAAGAVHGQVVEVADFLSSSSGFTFLGCQSFYQFTDLFLVVFSQKVECTETGIFSCQRMLFVPSATSILEKILTGRYGSIHVGRINA